MELMTLLEKLLKCLIFIVIGIVSNEILKKYLTSKVGKDTTTRLTSKHQQKKITTIKSMLNNFIKYIILIFVILSILAVFGINVKSILAGIGISAAILGLAFQDAAKDIIAGFTIITEDQYEIGDNVTINGFTGEVVFIGLRSTRVRDFKGATNIIANHAITEVINYNLHDSLALIDTPINREEDFVKIDKIFNKLKNKLDGNIPSTTGNITLYGIEKLNNNTFYYRLSVPCKPYTQFTVERVLRKEIKEALSKEKIKTLNTTVEVYNVK